MVDLARVQAVHKLIDGPNPPGLGFGLSKQALRWTADSAEFGKRP